MEETHSHSPQHPQEIRSHESTEPVESGAALAAASLSAAPPTPTAAEYADLTMGVLPTTSSTIEQYEASIAMQQSQASAQRVPVQPIPIQPAPTQFTSQPHSSRGHGPPVPSVFHSTSQNIHHQGHSISRSDSMDGPPTNCNLIVNYLPHDMDDGSLRHLFEEFGQIVMTKVVRDKNTKKSLGYGFVKYLNENDAFTAIQRLNGFSIGSKQLKVSVARPPSLEIRNCKLYITNLPRDFGELDVVNIFQRFGEIIECRVLRDRNAKHNKGVAFVQFNLKSQANAALSMNGCLLEGTSRPLVVKYAEDQHKKREMNRLAQQSGFSPPFVALHQNVPPNMPGYDRGNMMASNLSIDNQPMADQKLGMTGVIGMEHSRNVMFQQQQPQPMLQHNTGRQPIPQQQLFMYDSAPSPQQFLPQQMVDPGRPPTSGYTSPLTPALPPGMRSAYGNQDATGKRPDLPGGLQNFSDVDFQPGQQQPLRNIPQEQQHQQQPYVQPQQPQYSSDTSLDSRMSNYNEQPPVGNWYGNANVPQLQYTIANSLPTSSMTAVSPSSSMMGTPHSQGMMPGVHPMPIMLPTNTHMQNSRSFHDVMVDGASQSSPHQSQQQQAHLEHDSREQQLATQLSNITLSPESHPISPSNIPTYSGSITLLLSNLPSHANVEMLHGLFSPFGRILSAEIDVDPKAVQQRMAGSLPTTAGAAVIRNVCSGRGRVQFASLDQAQQAAHALDGKTLGDSTEPIQVALQMNVANR